MEIGRLLQTAHSPLLHVRDLAFERDDTPLFGGVGFSLAAGDILQIEGPNGCGKTTLLRLLTGALQPCAGEVLWQGRPIRLCRYDYHGSVLFMGHQVAVKPTLTAEENLRWLAGLLPVRNGLSASQALVQVGLAGYEDVPCYTLSAGQQRRVALARLLLADAPLWILDEPFTAIDKQGLCFLRDLLRQHAGGGGAVILSTHQDIGMDNLRRFDLGACRHPGICSDRQGEAA